MPPVVQAREMADYLEKAREMIVEEKNEKGKPISPAISKADLSDKNQLFLEDLIKKYPNSSAYRALRGLPKAMGSNGELKN